MSSECDFTAALTESAKPHLDSIAVHKDGSLLVSASNLTRKLWTGSLRFFKQPASAPHATKADALADLAESHGAATDLKWVGDSSKFIAAADSGAVMLWELDGEDSLKCLAEPTEHDDLVLSVDVSSDLKKAYSVGYDGLVKIWDLEEFVSLKSLKGHSKCVNCVVSHPTDANLFFTASKDSKIILWDTRKEKPASIVRAPSHGIATCLACHPSSSLLAIGTEVGHLSVYDYSNQTEKTSLQPHTRQINKLAFSSQATHLASASNDCTTKIFSASDFNLIGQDDRHKDFVRCAAWDHKDNVLYSCGWDGQVLKTDVSDTEMAVNGR